MKHLFKRVCAFFVSTCIVLTASAASVLLISANTAEDAVLNNYGTVCVTVEGSQIELRITDYVTAANNATSKATYLVDSAFETYNQNHNASLTTADITKITVIGKDSEQYLVGADFNVLRDYINNSTGLVSVDFSAVNMANSAFTSANLSDTNKNILGNAFSGCAKLAEVKLPNTLAQINNNGAFRNCTELTAFVYPPNLTKLGDDIAVADGLNANRMFFLGTAVRRLCPNL